MAMKPSDMAARIARGLLSFPVTHFDAETASMPTRTANMCPG